MEVEGHCMTSGLFFLVLKHSSVLTQIVSYGQQDTCGIHNLLWVLIAVTGSWGSQWHSSFWELHWHPPPGTPPFQEASLHILRHLLFFRTHEVLFGIAYLTIFSMNSINCTISWNSSHFGLPEFSALIFSVQGDCLVCPFLCCGLQKSLRKYTRTVTEFLSLSPSLRDFSPFVACFQMLFYLFCPVFHLLKAAKVNLVLVTPLWLEWKSISVFSF